jgi:cysteine synthase A
VPAKFNSILETVGNTPLVRLSKLAPAHVNLYVKLEAFNPMGSVKDRLAWASSKRRNAAARFGPDRP